MRLLHQAGHNTTWNYESHTEDGTGDGIIFAPRFERRGRIVDDFNSGVKPQSLFDPQFFLPAVPVGDLDTYDFHPNNVASGFETDHFAGELAEECARGCVEFQQNQGFKDIIIPTRYVQGMPSDYLSQMDELFVRPHLDALNELGTQQGQGTLLQLVLNGAMIGDEEYRSDLLNWVTGIQEIDGIYLLIEKRDRDKQIQDVEYLYWLLRFVDALRVAQMEVVVGYCNTEGVVLSLADPTAITMGAFGNLRMFRIDTFQESDGGGPGNAQIFSSKLLQWFDRRYRGAVMRALNTSQEEFFVDNQYKRRMFEEDREGEFNWHPNKPEIYKHFFLVYDQVISSVSSSKGEVRFDVVEDLLSRAQRLYSEIGGEVIFNPGEGGDHLAPWITATNQFSNYKGWT